MTATIKLTMTASPGAILRIIGIAERRGYDPVDLSANNTNGIISIMMTVKAERPIQILVAQLTRLFGVNSVEVYHESKIRVA